MRRPISTNQGYARGLTSSALRWRIETGQWQRAARGVYVSGSEPLSKVEQALALVRVTNGVASGALAGWLWGLDSIELAPPFSTVAPGKGMDRPGVRRRALEPADVTTVYGVPVTNGLQTVIDLAAATSDLVWEQILESALRKSLLSLDDLDKALETRRIGNSRIRRVLELRPPGAPPTESLLETLAAQLIRTDRGLPVPERQHEILDQCHQFVARLDLAWPELGVFIELDGQQHLDQPVYDARRETAVVAATGWLPARFTWTEIVHHPKATLRRLVDIVRMAAETRIPASRTS